MDRALSLLVSLVVLLWLPSYCKALDEVESFADLHAVTVVSVLSHDIWIDLEGCSNEIVSPDNVSPVIGA